jgi:hypothetical protein
LSERRKGQGTAKNNGEFFNFQPHRYTQQDGGSFELVKSLQSLFISGKEFKETSSVNDNVSVKGTL